MTINQIARLMGKENDEKFKNDLQYCRALTRAINKLVPAEEREGQSSHRLMILAERHNHQQIHT